MNESFEVLSVSRDDLKRINEERGIGFTDEQIDELSDRELEWIASHMATDPLMDAYWEAIAYLLTDLGQRAQKQQTVVGPAPPQVPVPPTVDQLLGAIPDPLGLFKKREETGADMRRRRFQR